MERVAAGSLHPNPALSGALPWMKVSILRVESENGGAPTERLRPTSGARPSPRPARNQRPVPPRARFSLRRLRALAVVCV